MTDTTVLAAQQAVPTAADTAQRQQTQFDPVQTRAFASLMAHGTATPSTAAPGAFSDFAASMATQFGQTRSFEEIRHSMLTSFDIHDPIGSMYAMTSNSMEAHALFAKLHISTSLASAATSLFGSLLKNQQ